MYRTALSNVWCKSNYIAKHDVNLASTIQGMVPRLGFQNKLLHHENYYKNPLEHNDSSSSVYYLSHLIGLEWAMQSSHAAEPCSRAMQSRHVVEPCGRAMWLSK